MTDYIPLAMPMPMSRAQTLAAIDNAIDIAIGSIDFSSFVPYTGATQNIDAGAFTVIAENHRANNFFSKASLNPLNHFQAGMLNNNTMDEQPYFNMNYPAGQQFPPFVVNMTPEEGVSFQYGDGSLVMSDGATYLTGALLMWDVPNLSYGAIDLYGDLLRINGDPLAYRNQVVPYTGATQTLDMGLHDVQATRFKFGSTGPQLDNSSGTIRARTNNGLADAPISASNITASGNITSSGSTFTFGDIVFGSSGGPRLRNSSGALLLRNNADTANGNMQVGEFGFGPGGNCFYANSNYHLVAWNGAIIGWSAASGVVNGTAFDTTFSRLSPGNIQVGSGTTANASGNLYANSYQLYPGATNYAAASLHQTGVLVYADGIIGPKFISTGMRMPSTHRYEFSDGTSYLGTTDIALGRASANTAALYTSSSGTSLGNLNLASLSCADVTASGQINLGTSGPKLKPLSGNVLATVGDGGLKVCNGAETGYSAINAGLIRSYGGGLWINENGGDAYGITGSGNNLNFDAWTSHRFRLQNQTYTPLTLTATTATFGGNVTANGTSNFGSPVGVKLASAVTNTTLLEVNPNKVVLQGDIFKVWGYQSSFFTLAQTNVTGPGSGLTSPTLKMCGTWNASGTTYTPTFTMTMNPTEYSSGYTNFAIDGYECMRLAKVDGNRPGLVQINSPTITEAQLNVTPSWDNKKGIVVRSSSSTQAYNLFETQSSTGTTEVSISPGGKVTCSNLIANSCMMQQTTAPTLASNRGMLWTASSAGTIDGVAYDQGDILLTSNVGGVSKTALLFDYSTGLLG